METSKIIICPHCNRVESFERITHYILTQPVLRIDIETQEVVLAYGFKTEKEMFYQCSECKERIEEPKFLAMFGAKST